MKDDVFFKYEKPITAEESRIFRVLKKTHLTKEKNMADKELKSLH